MKILYEETRLAERTLGISNLDPGFMKYASDVIEHRSGCWLDKEYLQELYDEWNDPDR